MAQKHSGQFMGNELENGSREMIKVRQEMCWVWDVDGK